MISIQPVSESSLLISVADTISPEASDQISAITHFLQEQYAELIIDLIPSYTTILVSYRLTHPEAESFISQFQTQLPTIATRTRNNSQTIREIPAYFGQEVGWDLEDLCQHAQLSRDEVLNLFCSTVYRVYAIGFSPGFAYMGSIPEALKMPRLETPRARVPKSSVAIADRQTAIYPDNSPGGWRILGRTPFSLLPSDDNALTLTVGEQVRFTPITQQEFIQLGGSLT
ncbi:5-oxoprolinase subunit B family protein [Parendozoicomonas haliclonae]|uniref:Kinase A inhibitor n=1 Tax=Parendozoicomonas haliclonae TaxID=1960125 RepID=A0A1X7AHS9_9GAMM|nr:allophanate hydrolase subunit 1 [Parendozoicomonas haliclonae]SMA42029.1 Kinase A inhibitor [Parendozoicomonas haliclonae]